FNNDYLVSTWNEHNEAVYENFVTSKQMIFIVLMIIVFVAAFYTASVAQQMIQDDMKEIAILKLIGTNDTMVKESAFISIFFVTISGIILGLGLGVFLGYNIGSILKKLSNIGLPSLSFYLLDFTITIPFISILIIIASLLLISAFAIGISLRKTTRITPQDLFTSL
ncbi:MAG: FtsX-like permease family protein, partial [Sphaerochaetaceae bacterium]|nr:FtsX-like permease family protein [Sphaerochaetaceae bacterium]